MDERTPRLAPREDLLRAYKRLLQTCLDRRPSGTRLKIATALGKHKSFVSQITNPAYPAPIPARHLATIFEICHFSAEERAAFMAAYRAAHPRRSQAAGRDAAGEPEQWFRSGCPTSVIRVSSASSRRPSGRPRAASSRW